MANGTNKNNKPDGKLNVATIAMAIGILLVLFGLWQLAERFLGTWFFDIWLVFSTIINIAWPLVLIAGGIVIVVAARNGKLNIPADRKLYRSVRNKKIAGVCGGIAEYLNADPAVVRVAAIILGLLCWYVVVPLYILLWIVLDSDTRNYNTWV